MGTIKGTIDNQDFTPMPLTVAQVKSIKEPGRYRDSPNLYLQVVPKGTRSWLFQYMINGRTRMMGLGSVADVSLAEARAKRDECRKLLREGVDPLGHREATKAARPRSITFAEAAEEYLSQRKAAWRNPKTLSAFRAALANHAKSLAKVPVDAITLDHVTAVLKPIWSSRPVTASKLRGSIERVLGYATAHGYRVGDNPASWSTLQHVFPSPESVRRTEHHPAMPYAEVPAFMAELREREGIAPRALEFVILTACRTSEALGARWSEVDLKAAVWTVPGDRMKSKRPFRVPLSPPAVALLKAMPREESNPHIFFSPTRYNAGLSNVILLKHLHSLRSGYSVHGFRSAFRDFASEQTDAPREVAEAALSHALGDATERAYARSDLFDRRRKLMDEWAAFIGIKDASRS